MAMRTTLFLKHCSLSPFVAPMRWVTASLGGSELAVPFFGADAQWTLGGTEQAASLRLPHRKNRAASS